MNSLVWALLDSISCTQILSTQREATRLEKIESEGLEVLDLSSIEEDLLNIIQPHLTDRVRGTFRDSLRDALTLVAAHLGYIPPAHAL